MPSAPIAPTAGHAFTNPSLNFGGEHFGVGYSGSPSAVKYNWLLDGGGVLTVGPAVNVATPIFTYVPPVVVVGVPPAPPQVQAVIVPPPPPVLPSLEFGTAGWVKEIRTTSHTNSEVKLRNLVSPDAAYPGLKDWRNGEPDEVETEWQILQIDYGAGNGGANGQLAGAPQALNQGDDVVTRRYEFYAYVGPLDPETGEALGASVAADGIHGTGSYSNTVVVGTFLGTQMSAFNNVLPLGLIDHLPDGQVNQPYAHRSVVIGTDTNWTVTTSGALPGGMAFDPGTAQVYGTPWTNGVFQFHVEASGTNATTVARTYVFSIAAAGVVLPPHCDVDTLAAPLKSGTTTGDGVYNVGAVATVAATPAAGFVFVNWTENDQVVGVNPNYTFTNALNQALVANFTPAVAGGPQILTQPAGLTLNQGQTATFNVIAQGAAPLAYQWRWQGTALAGATGPGLSLTNVQGTNAGAYTVVVTNAQGAVTSAVATLTVRTPPAITNQPMSVSVGAGTPVTFTVGATGTPPLGYQWRFNGTNLAGATAAGYSLPAAQTFNAGAYSVQVTNALGTNVSATATLTVTVPPVLLQAGRAGGTWTVSFNSLPGTNYVVQFSPDLRVWTTLTNVTAPGTVAGFSDALTNRSRFYRVNRPTN